MTVPPMPADADALDTLRAALLARHAPADEVEAHWVEEAAFAMWRQRRLRRIEAAALDAAEAGGTSEPEAAPFRPPSLGTLARYRARVDRDLRLAREMLEAARQERPSLPAAARGRAAAPRLRWLADRLAAGTAANDGTIPSRGTNEPDAELPKPAMPDRRAAARA